MVRWPIPFFLAGLLLFAAACGIQVIPRGSPGGLMAPASGAGTPSHYVRYEVRCWKCTVCYTGGEEECEGGVEGVWARNVRIMDENIRQVWIEATPDSADTWIRQARIHVDGRLIAEFDGDRNPRLGATISLSGAL